MTPILQILADEKCRIEPDGRIVYPDPLGRASVAMAIEDEYGIEEITEDEAEQCVTVDDWEMLVKVKTG